MISSPTTSSNGYGTFTIDAAGEWIYTLDNSNAAVQALDAGQPLIDTFTVVTIDGTQQVVTITITGANDAAVISGDITGTVVEASGVANGTPEMPTATGNLNSPTSTIRPTPGRRSARQRTPVASAAIR